VKGTSNGSGGADPRGSELCLWDLLMGGKHRGTPWERVLHTIKLGE
jgi:hypothetical protein